MKKCNVCGNEKQKKDITEFSEEFSVCQTCIDKKHQKKFMTPGLIFKSLSKYIIGQDKAKKILSIAIATHYRRQEDPSIEKSNILLIGPTGSGKTEIARTVSQLFGLPMAIADATSFTAHGYVGEDVESVVYQLLGACDWDVKKAETGIVFIDEIDKIARGQEGSYGPQIGTVRVQQSLLKMIEGGKIKLVKPGNKKNNETDESIYFDTSKVLFICAGAFPGLEEIVNRKKTSISLQQKIDVKEKNEIAPITVKNLSEYGLIPEFIGRLPVIVQTELLSIEQLTDILCKTSNSLTKQYTRLMNSYGVQVEFTSPFLKSVAKEAFDNGTGARGLRSIMEKRLEPLLFDGPSLGVGKMAKVKVDEICYIPFTTKTKEQEPIVEEVVEQPPITVEVVAKTRRAKA